MTDTPSSPVGESETIGQMLARNLSDVLSGRKTPAEAQADADRWAASLSLLQGGESGK